MKEKNKPAVITSDFSQKDVVTELKDTEELFLLKCPNCQGVHFRHAGYMVPLLPYGDPRKPGEVQISAEQKPVNLCIKCKTAILYHDTKVHDVSKFVDLKAWEKTEKQAHKETGPGGQC